MGVLALSQVVVHRVLVPTLFELSVEMKVLYALYVRAPSINIQKEIAPYI